MTVSVKVLCEAQGWYYVRIFAPDRNGQMTNDAKCLCRVEIFKRKIETYHNHAWCIEQLGEGYMDHIIEQIWAQV